MFILLQQPNGVEMNYGMGELSSYEQSLLEEASKTITSLHNPFDITSINFVRHCLNY